jgi:Histidine kinase-, DNA gyrase B-, and HSP90-like ATPase
VLSIIPDTGVLESFRRQGITWFVRCGELIDNAFGAKATTVSFEFEKKRLTITDDGNGCPTPLAMVRLGGRYQQPGDTIGKYGIGLKDASISTCHQVTIATVHAGIERRLSCNWQHIEKTGRWEIEDPTERDATWRGTIIIFDNIFCGPPRDHDELIADLSLTYTPAIKQGKQIKITWRAGGKLVTVPEFTFPVLEDDRTAALNVFRKLARVRIGLIPEGQPTRTAGLILAHSFRVIKKNVRRGLSDNPIPSLFGWVDLGDGWNLNKNKTDLTDDEEEELMTAIRREFADTIKKAEARSFTQQFAGVGELISAAVAHLRTNTRKARRGKKHQAGSVEAVGTERRHNQAERTQPGRTFPKRNQPETQVKIVFSQLGAEAESHKFGDDGTLEINSDIPFLQSIRANRPAVTLYAAQVVSLSLARKGDLFPESHDVSKICGDLLRGVREIERADATEAG